MKFKPGDLIVCIDRSFPRERIYRVVGQNRKFNYMIDFKDSNGTVFKGWLERRFVKAKQQMVVDLLREIQDEV